MLNRDNRHRQRQQENFLTNSQRLGMWLAIAGVILTSPQLWHISVFLGENVLAPQFGYETAALLIYALFGCIAMAAIYLGKMTLGSSIVLGAIWIISKSPIF